MNTENLKTFILLSKYKNFTRTAETLFVAQSTVTNRIAELEKELGKRLFERERKNVYLTEEGTRFLDYANRIIELEQAAVNDINISEKYPNKINIGSTNTIYDCHLKDKLKSYIKSNDNTALKITIAHSMPLIELLCDSVIDFAFTYVEYRKKGIECVPFCNDEMVLVTNCRNKEFAGGIKLKDLPSINYLYCNFTFQGIGEYIRDLFPKYHRFSFEIDRSANIIPYLENSNGYSFLPKSLIVSDLKKGSLIKIPLIDFDMPQIKSFAIYNVDSKYYQNKFLKYVT